MPGQPKLRTLSAEIEKRGGDQHVFDRIAAGDTVCSIGDSFGVSRQLIYRWIRSGGEEREAAWKAAKRQSADALVDDGLEILDAPAEGITSAEVQLRRGRTDYRKWLASVRNRAEYGERDASVNVAVSFGELHMEALLAAGSYASLKREPELLEAVIEEEGEA